MLMIWSSRARNRSFDPVVLCFFGRIVPSDATQNHARRFEGILKMKLQASGAPDPKSLQSKNPFPRKTESPIKVLQVLHGRLTKARGEKCPPLKRDEIGLNCHRALGL